MGVQEIMLEKHLKLDALRHLIAAREDKMAKAYPYRELMTFTEDFVELQALKETRYEIRKELWKLLTLEDSILN